MSRLDQKYRPKSFSEVVGHDIIIKILKNSLLQNRISSAYIFYGPSGVGKTTLSRIFAKAILCQNITKDAEPCNMCDSCEAFIGNSHISFKEIDAATVGGKENMIKLRDDAYFLSFTNKKIILIDECHDITKQGQDVLLEQIEESPPHLIYLFCTTDIDKVNKTLRNRCLELPVQLIDYQLIEQKLIFICEKENFEYEKSAINAISVKSGGYVRNAIKILEKVSYLGKINIENVSLVLKDNMEPYILILKYLGENFDEVINIFNTQQQIQPYDFYNFLIKAANNIYLYNRGITDYYLKNYENLFKDLNKDVDSKLLKILNFLIDKKKFNNNDDILSSLILLHYKIKYSKNDENTNVEIKINNDNNSNKNTNVKEETNLNYYNILNMNVIERYKFLRQIKKQQTDNLVSVNNNWPLTKEDSDKILHKDDVLSPEEFSKKLIGGRKDVIK